MRTWMAATVWLVGAVGGCDKASLTLVGQVEASPDDTQPAAGVGVTLRDGGLQQVDSARTGADGTFELVGPRRSEIHVILRDEGGPPISFRGDTGPFERFEIPSGTFFLTPQGWLDAFLGPFGGCPDAGHGGGLILGQSALDVQSGGRDRPPEPCSFAYAEREGERVDACYTSRLDEEGDVFVYDEDAEVVGPTGRFVIRGLSEGPWRLVVGRFQGCSGTERGSTSLLGESVVFVPDGGVVARLPALVPL